MLHVSVVTKTTDFADLRDEWSDLISRSPTATAFDTFAWQFNWWFRIGRKTPGSQLQIVLLRDNTGLLVGTIPLFTTVMYVWPMRKLKFLGAGMSDYHDIIASAGYEKTVAEHFMTCLDELLKWSCADLNQLREESILRRYLGSIQDPMFASLQVIQEECPYVELPGSDSATDRWEWLLSGYSKKMRANVRYYNRALDRVFSVDRKLAANKDEVNEGLAALFQLHQRRWNQRWLPGVFHNARVREFHRAAAVDLLDLGYLRLHVLVLDGSVEAALYCFSINGVTSYYQGGFEPSLSKWSLGSVVTSIAIQSAVVEGCTKFDFLRGDEPYKVRWTLGKSAWNHRWLVARRSFLGFSIVALITRIELRVEQRFKKWMHHRKSPENVKVVEKGPM